MNGLYIHVPFCRKKCRYCDFYSVATGPVCSEDGEAAPQFLAALKTELAQLPADFRADTVFIGGGTPTVLASEELAELCGMVRAAAGQEVAEWTVEANPGTLDREKAGVLFDAGVNRVSLGVQSFDAGVLSFLGRIHGPTEARDAYHLLRESGFANINIDLMYGVPVGSREIVRRDLEQIAALAPEHVSAYCLIFEPGTPLTLDRDAGRLTEVDDDEELEQYRLVRSLLAESGYEHYEISNFARPGFDCRHNDLYWSGGAYIGCGPAAHSHWAGERFANVQNLEQYCSALLSGESARVGHERLEPEAKARETLVMGLRRTAGVSRDAFRKETGFDYRDLRGAEIDWLCEVGLIEETPAGIRLTENGLFVSDSVFAELV